MAESAEQPFGKYRLLDRLATGGMAEIYRARLTGAAGVTKSVVIKKIHPHFAGDKSFVSMFINEAKITVGLSHGNIAQIFDFGEIDGEYFLAMEYVHGQPLSKVMKRLREHRIPVFPTPFAVMIAMEMCKGLHYAHTRIDEQGRPLNIIHRDVSPQNVIVSYEGQVKIVDFGIAKARTAGRSETEAGAMKGKYVYFSPEQARGKEMDARTDVFATGSVLYEMLCGRLPFEGKMIEVLSRIVQGDFPPPRELNPELSPALEKILLTALATDKEQRYPTAQHFQEALATYLYAHAPTFSAGSLSGLMSYLFEPELKSERRTVEIPSALLEQIPVWRTEQRSLWRKDAAPDSTEQPTVAGRKSRASRALPDQDESRFEDRGRPEELSAFIRARKSLRWLVWALPTLAALTAGLAVVVFGQAGTFAIALSSDPPGASVLINGRAWPEVTPVTIGELDPREPVLLQLTMPGRQTWAREVVPQPGATLAVHASLLPDRPLPPPRHAPPDEAGSNVFPTPVVAAAQSVPMEASYPVGSIKVEARQHAFLVPKSQAARVELDPRKTYRVWTEGMLSLGGMVDNVNFNQTLFYLEGPSLSGNESFGFLTPKAKTIRGASRLYAFLLDIQPADNTGAIKVRIQEKGSSRALSLLVDGRENTCEVRPSQRFILNNLDAYSTYELWVRDGSPSARTHGGKNGRLTKLLFHQQPGLKSLSGRKWSHDTQQVIEVGRKYRVSGTSWLEFTFLDHDATDNSGHLEIEILPLTGGGGMFPKLGHQN